MTSGTEASMGPLRIAYVLTCLGVGGAERQTLGVAERMAARGHKVVVVALTAAAGEELETRLPVLRLNMVKSLGGVLRGARFGRQFLEAFGPDVVHSHTFPANLLARLMQAQGLRVPLVNTIHNEFEGGWHRRVLNWLTDGLATRVTAVSRAAAMAYARPGRVEVVANGIDGGMFQPDIRRRRAVRREMRV
jgi:glycosyltransferase involved in cell wall biosynthesis